MRATFLASTVNNLIACANENDAYAMMTMLLKPHNARPELIQPGATYSAVPVIYTIEIDDHDLIVERAIIADDLHRYADATTIPFCVQIDHIQRWWINHAVIKNTDPIPIRTLPRLVLEQVVSASFLEIDGETFISRNMRTKSYSINLQILSSFIAALGVIAVAIAFAALNATTFAAGVTVAIVGISTTILGGIGLFKCAPEAHVPDDRINYAIA